jgi:CxxC motif-containing protein (DUF1111 family)
MPPHARRRHADVNESILRHAGEAIDVINRYRNLSNAQRNQIITFLQSL